MKAILKLNDNYTVRGPLTFLAGDARVVIYSDSESHMIQPCLL